jgi:hypothetical protein
LEAATLGVIEAELALHVFIDALGAPALHHDPNELLLGPALGQG